MRKNGFLLGLFLMLLMVYAIGCGNEQVPSTKTPVEQLTIQVQPHREQELVFAFSFDDFIRCFNSVYSEKKNSPYLAPKEEWMKTELERSVHTNHPGYQYEFSENQTVWTMPTISVYTPSDAAFVQGITVNFDDHSFREDMYVLYEELCFYTLKTVFYDLSEQRLTTLYQALNQLAYDNVFPNERGYYNDPVPCALYYRNGVGVYPYYAIGESVRMCVIPVTQESLKAFSQKGVALYELTP